MELDSGDTVVAAINLVVLVFDMCNSGTIIPPRTERGTSGKHGETSGTLSTTC